METHIKQISKLLIERGHCVTVHTSAVTLSNENLLLSDEVDGIRIKRYKPKINWGYYLSLFKPEISECDLIVLEGYPSLANDHVRKKYSGKYPMVGFSLGVVIATSGLSSIMKSVYDSLFGIKTLKASQSIIALTENEKKWCLKKGIDSSMIHIIPAGISDSAFEEYDSQIPKKKYNLRRFILFIGRMYHEKAPTHIVEAVLKLPEKLKDVGVIFVGPDAGEVAKVNEMAKKLGMSEKVVCTGSISEKEKFELLAGCQFFVLPSKFEAQGIVFIEAAAQKKAVVGTRVGGVPYIVKDKITGLLYDYGDVNTLTDHIRYLLENPKEAERMGEDGFKIASKEYRWKGIADKIENVYSEAVSDFKRKI